MFQYIQPFTIEAHQLMQRASETIDKRLKLDSEEVAEVLGFALSHSDKPFTLTGHKKVVDALLGEVLGRDSGRSTYFVKPAYRDTDAQWATSEQTGFGPYPRTKGGLWCRSQAAARAVHWEDIAGLGYGPAYFIAPVDFPSTYAAFLTGYKPSANFQSCDYHEDREGAAAFAETVEHAARLKGVGLVQIADGWLCSDPQKALVHFHSETTKHFNKAGLRFCFTTKDRYGRTETSWGSFAA